VTALEDFAMEVDQASPVDRAAAAQSLRKRFRWRWVVAGVASLIVVFLVVRYVLFDTDRSTQPVCHKQVDLAFSHWQDDHKGEEFPNVAGNSGDSLRELDGYMAGKRLDEKYMYVPGLRKGDPDDLVLMYLARPTRWVWHAGPQTIFHGKKWIVIPKDFALLRDGVRDGELNERMSFAEFQDRMQKTLDVLKKHKRPHWQAVVKEHSEFLAEAERKWGGG
jgi:hypothetical protein